jgi:ribosomal protein L34E
VWETGRVKIMPRPFGYVQSEETKEKIRKSLKGRIVSEETRNRLRKLRIGKSPSNKGVSMTEEQKRKLSEAHRGHVVSQETRKKISKFNKGKIPQNISLITGWNRGMKLPQFMEENAAHWLGDDVGYSGVHSWVKRHYGNAPKCEDCGKSGMKIGRRWNIDWSNCDHKYRRVREDYTGRCQKCHKKYDRENNLSQKH